MNKSENTLTLTNKGRFFKKYVVRTGKVDFLTPVGDFTVISKVKNQRKSMKYNFDQIIERRNTSSNKWTQYPADVLPLWVADMDFLTPAPIRNALHAMLDRGVLGYEFLQPRTRQIVAARMERLYGWQVDPGWVVATTGVVSGFNIAARAICKPGEGVLIHTPA